MISLEGIQLGPLRSHLRLNIGLSTPSHGFWKRIMRFQRNLTRSKQRKMKLCYEESCFISQSLSLKNILVFVRSKVSFRMLLWGFFDYQKKERSLTQRLSAHIFSNILILASLPLYQQSQYKLRYFHFT